MENKRLMTKLFVSAVTLIGVASAQSTFASEKVDDTKLAGLRGGSGYFTGGCSALTNDTTCAPSPAVNTGCGTCVGARCGSPSPMDTAYEGDRYTDTAYQYRFCTGAPTTNPANQLCRQGPGSRTTLRRAIFQQSAGLACTAPQRPGSPFRVCTKESCSDRATAAQGFTPATY
jgi:hypothetical protein